MLTDEHRRGAAVHGPRAALERYSGGWRLDGLPCRVYTVSNSRRDSRDRFGHIVLTISGLWWGITAVPTGMVPDYIVHGASAAFVTVIALRFLLGVRQGTTYPVAITAVSQWFPQEQYTPRSSSRD